MRIQIDSKHTDLKSLGALREFITNPTSNELRVRSNIIEMCSMEYDRYSIKPEINIDFRATAECFPSSNTTLIGQIVSLFEGVSDPRDLEFLKRYFDIKFNKTEC